MSRWNPGRRRDVSLSARLRLRVKDLFAVAAWPLRRRARGAGSAGFAERFNDVIEAPAGRVMVAAVCLEMAAVITRL